MYPKMKLCMIPPKQLSHLSLPPPPQRNEEFEIWKFLEQKQESGEDLESFYARLKTMAVNCNFTDIDREVKSQLIQTCSSYSLSELLILGRTQDAASRQRKLMERVSATGAGTPWSCSCAMVNKMTAQKPKKKMLSRRSETPEVAKSSNKTCYNCGGTWPHGKGKECLPCVWTEVQQMWSKKSFSGACPGFLKGGGGPISLGSLKKGHQILKGGGVQRSEGGVKYICLTRTTNFAYLDAEE